MVKCGLCGGHGHRVIAAISDPHWTSDGNGRPTLTCSFILPVVVPCICTAERADSAADTVRS